MNKIVHILVVINTIILCFIMGACSNRPKGVLSSGKMEDVLVDYHLLKSMSNNLPPQERYKAILYEKAFYKQHDITKAQFDSSLVWYTSHTEDFAKIYEKVTARLKKKEVSYENAGGSQNSQMGIDNNQISANGDTASIMKMPNYYCLSNSPVSSNESFSISPNNINPRDIIIFSIRCSLMSLSAQGTLMLSVTYNNDSTITDYRSINSSGNYIVRVQNNNPITIRSIKALIYCGSNINNGRTFMIIDKMSMIRIHVHTPAPINNRPPIQIKPLQSVQADTNKAHMVKLPNNAAQHPIGIGGQTNANNNNNQVNATSQEAAHATQVLQNEPMDASKPRPISTNRNEIMKKLSERAKKAKK